MQRDSTISRVTQLDVTKRASFKKYISGGVIYKIFKLKRIKTNYFCRRSMKFHTVVRFKPSTFISRQCGIVEHTPFGFASEVV
jgi:hypothetical protein